MIDIHSHLLPGIDDGADSLETALAMMRLAVADGIDTMVFTPHIHPGRYENTCGGIAKALQRFQSALNEAGISMKTAAAAEIRISPEIPQMIEEGQLPFIGELEGYQLFLLEFPHGQILPGSDRMIGRLLANKVRPIIVHPERNKDVLRRLDKIWPFVEMGCLLQLTAASVAGGFGEPARKRSVQMLEKGWVSLLASDAHNVDHRPPVLGQGRKAAAEIVGEDESLRLVRDNPWAIVSTLFERQAA